MKKSELINIIREELTSMILENPAPLWPVQDLNGKPAIDLRTKSLRSARRKGNVLVVIFRKHLKKIGMPLGTQFAKGPNGNFFLTATGK